MLQQREQWFLKAKEEAITRRLVQRAEDTVTNQSRMLSSILDRDFCCIVIDRIVTVDSNNVPTLHTNPDDILKIAPTQFRALTHPRRHQFDSISPEWASIYSPLQHINDSIYHSTNLRRMAGCYKQMFPEYGTRNVRHYIPTNQKTAPNSS